ncbi:hypothetical protein CLV42_12279 [Chitinophaga ginsengisoli]|uniref:Uncharacterized protein n=1 Tax=Chitinophaga ginsengisoli TaxID=363837 RepID=A0A2P8FL44_9BACT|nr:hypothetical protein CLV42_12279 [Chitinophaga ginsengisoli]
MKTYSSKGQKAMKRSVEGSKAGQTVNSDNFSVPPAVSSQ